jgi:CHAD domain-containing protein
VLTADREYLVIGAATAPSPDLDAAVLGALRKLVERPGQLGQLGRSGHVVAEPTIAIRRTWFDTFDWRLHKAGLCLSVVQSGRAKGASAAHLRLASPTDVVTVPTAEPTGVRMGFPSDAVVPPGVLRSRLDPVVEMRALIPVATLRTAVMTYRLLNDDEKTVARVVVERATGVGAGGASGRAVELAPRVSVVTSRGYESEAAAAARVVAKIPGLTKADQSMAAQAMAAIGRVPGDYSGKLDVALDAELATDDAVRRVLRALLDTAHSNLAGVTADLDTEFLHDLRVAVRRGRTTLKVTAGALPVAETTAAATALKWLGDVTTPTRDLDVYLLGLDDLAAEVVTPGWNVAHLEPFRAFLLARRAAEQAALVRHLRSARARRAFATWAAAATPSTSNPLTSPVQSPLPPHIGAVAKKSVRRVFRSVIKNGSRITGASPASDLHDLRKRCKELRYTLEIFAALHDPAAHRSLVDDLKKLQDCLGEFQDTEVQQHAIRQFAEDMLAGDGAAPTTVDAVMAMGRLADRLEERQLAARTRFGQLFDGFAGPGPRSHLSALYEPAT